MSRKKKFNYIKMRNQFILLCLLSLSSTSVLLGQVMRQVKPSDTNPLITTFNSDSNYVYLNTNIPSKNVLVVHLPGSYGEPKRARLFGTLAANLGFHSIGLMYPNIPTVGSICTNSSNSDCFEEVRKEIIEGIDHSPSISIGSSECILDRTQKLLMYLSVNFPSENWGQYLDANNDLIFSQIIFSGHSQGGGHAALIAKLYPIKRAICLSSPKDWRNATNAPPVWLSNGNWQTPKSEIYSFNHTLDEQDRQLEIWDSLGIDSYGIPSNVDSQVPPYNHTRQLTTSYAVAVGDEHACTIQDNKTPKENSLPIFTAVWTYMLTDNLVTSFPEKQAKQLVGTPNPVNNIVNLHFTTANFTICIYDNTGKKVMEKYHSTEEVFPIDISSLQSGLYFIQATNNKSTLNTRILKK